MRKDSKFSENEWINSFAWLPWVVFDIWNPKILELSLITPLFSLLMEHQVWQPNLHAYTASMVLWIPFCIELCVFFSRLRRHYGIWWKQIFGFLESKYRLDASNCDRNELHTKFHVFYEILVLWMPICVALGVLFWSFHPYCGIGWTQILGFLESKYCLDASNLTCNELYIQFYVFYGIVTLWIPLYVAWDVLFWSFRPYYGIWWKQFFGFFKPKYSSDVSKRSCNELHTQFYDFYGIFGALNRIFCWVMRNFVVFQKKYDVQVFMLRVYVWNQKYSLGHEKLDSKKQHMRELADVCCLYPSPLSVVVQSSKLPFL
jgi:hypothetical protein